MDNRTRLVNFFENFYPGKTDFSKMREDFINDTPKDIRPLFYNDVTQITRNYLLLDHLMTLPLKKGQKISRSNRAVIFCALYDIIFRAQPPHVVNEYINLVKHKKDKGFVNWLLRTVLQTTGTDPESLPLPSSKIKEISMKYSFPVDFTVKLSTEFNKKKAEDIFKVLSREVPSVYMPNKSAPELSTLNCPEILPDIYTICDMNAALQAQREGKILIFEKTSMFPVYLLDAQEGEEILDLAASPGNKSFMIYNQSKGKVKLTLNDPDPQRYDFMVENVKKWGMDMETVSYDGRNFPLQKKYDAVFVDAPCSNTGVISKKPDIKFKLKNTQMNKLRDLQFALVKRGLQLLKPGGRLVYSICSFLKEEIAPLVEEIEASTEFRSVISPVHFRLKKFSEDKYFRIIPSEDDPVGFSMALFKSK
ncbi:RsmB/NOP family class I SAM-dependent RNA methyltransferase [bacterium]|nr:RsmB/NOP family class I SAM-dependent RNA methyltransferase [bacterium]